MSIRRLLMVVAVGCGGGGGARGTAPSQLGESVHLEAVVAIQQWYRSPSRCAQGPFDLELETDGSRWGEEIELRVHAPRLVALHATIAVDDVEVANTSGVFDRSGRVEARPDNARCVADARERLALGRAGVRPGGAVTPGVDGPGVPGEGGVPGPPRASETPRLELESGEVGGSIVVVRVQLPERPTASGRVRIRLWSIEPNDLEGVLFGATRIVWRPNVTEHAYEAHLAAQAERLRREAELDRRRQDEARQRAEAEAQRRRAQVRVTVETDHDRAVRLELEIAERRRAQLTLEAELRARRARLERDEAARRRRAIEVALEVERRARRAAFCASHPEDRGCWGAGGLRVHLDLQARADERARYCAQHGEDARCWSAAEKNRRRTVWNARIKAANTPPAPPDGPPPSPLAEQVPPRLSANADWRAGYWHWLDGQWIWLGGMWRVPERDIVSEDTTIAPSAPPPPPTEAPTQAPARTAVWIAGFWQWDGHAWMWIAGSWQLRPTARVTWEAPVWRPRGAIHVLIPGRWIQIGGGR